MDETIDETKWFLRSRRVLGGIMAALPFILGGFGVTLDDATMGQLGKLADALCFAAAGILWLWSHYRPDPRALTLTPQSPPPPPPPAAALFALLLVPWLGCAAGGSVDPKTSYLRSLQVYNAAASSMALYCEQPGADAKACASAAKVAQTVVLMDAAVMGAGPCVPATAGTVTVAEQQVCTGDWALADSLLEAAAAALRAHATGGVK
jgi:hypothetical protein